MAGKSKHKLFTLKVKLLVRKRTIEWNMEMRRASRVFGIAMNNFSCHNKRNELVDHVICEKQYNEQVVNT